MEFVIERICYLLTKAHGHNDDAHDASRSAAQHREDVRLGNATMDRAERMGILLKVLLHQRGR